MGGEWVVLGNEDLHLSFPEDEQRHREKSHVQGAAEEMPSSEN